MRRSVFGPVVAASVALMLAGCGWRLETREAEDQVGAGKGAPAERALAPDFSLPDDGGTLVTLDELLAAGRPAVLVFYRGHWWPYCRDQLGKLAKREDELARLGVRLVAISVDPAADAQALREKLNLDFPLLTDEGARAAAAYGVAMKGQDLAVPSTFVVMPNREIFWEYVGENPSDRPPEDVVFEQLELALAELAVR